MKVSQDAIEVASMAIAQAFSITQEGEYDASAVWATSDEVARVALEAAQPHLQERVVTVARLDALLNCDRNVIVINDEGTPFQNLWGGWKSITMASFFDSERLHRSFGPHFTVIHIGPEDAE